jgi:hypothetical protein
MRILVIASRRLLAPEIALLGLSNSSSDRYGLGWAPVKSQGVRRFWAAPSS